MDEPFGAGVWWLRVDRASLLNYLARFALPRTVEPQEQQQEQQFDAAYGPWLLDQWADLRPM